MEQLYIIGHPNCGLNYIKTVCEQLISNVEIITDTVVSSKMNASNTMIVLMNPVKAIPLIFQDNNTLEYRRKEILTFFKFDLNSLENVDKAAMSYLYWLNMLRKELLKNGGTQCYNIKVECPANTIKQFAQEQGKEFLKGSIIPPFREKSVEIELSINPDIIEQLNEHICGKFNYEEIKVPKTTIKPRTQATFLQQQYGKTIIHGPRRRNVPSNYSIANPTDDEEPREIEEGLMAIKRREINIVQSVQSNTILTPRDRKKLGGSFSVKR